MSDTAQDARAGAGAGGDAREEQVQRLIDAVASPIRREILWLVRDRELPAGEIAATFAVSGPTISAHLAALRGAGLVSMRRDGNFRRYRANPAALRVLRPLLATGGERWQAADDIPERDLASAATQRWVTVTVDLPGATQEAAFTCFSDGSRYSAWLGVPVTIEGDRFAAELEWGTHIRGRYEVVAPPHLIAMRWDFEDDAVPVPGHELVAYLRIDPSPGGCAVVIHQCAADEQQEQFLTAAWSMVLGRLRTWWDGPGHPEGTPRPRRTKRR